jgi:hypothetical protein
VPVLRVRLELLVCQLKEALEVEVVVLNRTAVSIGIVENEREREEVLFSSGS